MVQIEERMAGQAAILAVSGDITMGGGSRCRMPCGRSSETAATTSSST
jgi:hypothetical protein